MPLADLPRQSIYSRMAGYEDVNDAERVAQDPTFRLIGPHKIWERGAALTLRLQSFETEPLTQEKNLLEPTRQSPTAFVPEQSQTWARDDMNWSCEVGERLFMDCRPIDQNGFI